MEFGVEVDDPADVPDAIRRHRLVVCRRAGSSLEQQVDLTARIGRLVGDVRDVRDFADVADVAQVRHEDERRMSDDQRYFNEQWHADVSWSAEGPVVSVLVALEAGRFVAPTAFVDTVSGLAGLPAARRPPDDAVAWHHVERSRIHRHGRGTPAPVPGRTQYVPEPISRPGAAPPTLVHEPGASRPVIVTHEPTGERGVSLGDHAWTMDPDDPASPAAVDALQAALVDAGAHYVHRWRVGDLVAWDNRTVLHRREPRRWNHRRGERVLRRTAAWPEP